MKQKPKFNRKILRVFGIMILVFVLFTVILLLPATQTYLGQRVTASLDERFGTKLTIDNIHISPFGYATLENVLAIDHKQDTLLYVGYARTSALRLGAVLQGDNNLGAVFLRDVKCNITTYSEDEESNIDMFFDRFDSEKPKPPNATFYVSNIQLTKAALRIHNENKPDALPLQFAEMNADIKDFSVVDGVIRAEINQLDTNTSWKNTQLTSLSGTYMLSATQMSLKNASIQTASSTIETDIVLQFPKKGLKRFTELVALDITIQKANLGEIDLKTVMPDWMLGSIDFSGNLFGTVEDLSVQNAILNNDENRLEFSLASENILEEKHRKLIVNWKLNTDKILALFGNKLSNKNSDVLTSMGVVSSNGSATFSANTWNVTSSLDTELGKLSADATYIMSSNAPSYNIELNAALFDIGTLLTIPTLNTAGFDVKLSGKGLNIAQLNATANGTLYNLSYRSHTYDKVELQGNVSPERFRGNMMVTDAALDLSLEGEIDFVSEVRNFSFTTDINKADFAVLGWIPKNIEGVFSGSVDLALQGNTIDEMIGDLYIEQGKLETLNKVYVFSSVAAQSRLTNNIRVINLSSEDVATGLMIGEFKPTELLKLAQNTLGSQYSNYVPKEITPNQYLDFNFNFRGKIASALFGEGVVLDDNTFVKGKINATEKLFQLNIRAPKLQFKTTKLDMLEIEIDTHNPLYHSFISFDELESPQGKLVQMNWINSQIEDKLYGRAEFRSFSTPDKLNQLNTSFTLNELGQAVLGIQNADFYFNKRRWKLDVTETLPLLTANSATDFLLSTLVLKSNTSKISVAATQKGADSFSLGLNLEQVALADILSFRKDKWEGLIDGFLNIQQTANGFGGSSSLQFSELKLNDVSLGDAFLSLQSQAQKEAYSLAFRIEEDGVDVVSATGNIGIENRIPFWNIDAGFVDYNLSALAGLTNTVFDPFDGKANGNLQLNSTDGNITSSGVLNVDAFRLGVPYLNTNYSFNSTVPFVFTKDKISIQSIPFQDTGNHTGILNGELTHQSFSDWGLDMQIDADNLEVLNTDFSENALYYGTAFFNGNAHLHGPFSNMEIDVTGQTAKGTSLFIPIQYDTAIGDVSFINFVEKDEEVTAKNLALTTVKGLQMNFDLDVTPDAEVEIVVDPETKSFLRGVGAGNLLLEIDTAGSFAMWGDFIAFEGVYNFKNLGLIDKTFRLRPGGTIVWEGDPYGAQINMQAVYDVPGGANPAILLEGDNVSQKIPTEVTINLFGNLLNPETPTFEIDFPNASGVMKNELNYRLNDQERSQLQAISLLSQGSFINQVSLAAISSQTLTNNLFQKASGVFDNIFTSENDKLNLSLNYLQGDRNAAASIQNRDRLGVSLSTNINERIIIDGKVGVPVGSEEETTIIGDVTLEFLLNKQGTLRARVFNRENEFQYFGDELGYTQGIGVNYKVRFDSFNELVRKVLNNKN
ncbi:MAG: hypothetical protein GWO82_03805 [Bacteroidetes bacterium]|nr:hypothetical protein [Bacteroidota bacterium]